MKKFAIGMIISAVDKVTAPINGIVKNVQNASARMSSAMSKATARIHGEKQGKEGGMFGEMFKAEAAWDVLKETTEKVIDFGKECVDAGDEASISFQRLKTLMTNVKGTTIENVSAVSELAEKISQKTVLDASALKYGQSQLASYQLTATQIKQLTPALADLAAAQYGVNASGEQLYNSANQIGKVFVGETGALKRAGISFSGAEEKIMKTGTAAQKTAELVKVLHENYGGLAESLTKTSKGKAAQSQHMIRLVQEQIGNALSPISDMWNKALVEMLPTVAVFAKKLPGVIDGGLSALTKTAQPLLMSFGKIVAPAFAEFKKPAVVNALKQIGAAFMRILPLVVQIFGAVLRTGLKMVAVALPTIVPMIQRIADVIVVVANGALWLWNHALSPLLVWLAGFAVPWILRFYLGWLAVVEAVQIAGKWFSAVWNNDLLPFFQKVGKWFSDTWNKARNVFDSFKTWFLANWKTILDVVSPGLGLMANVFDKAAAVFHVKGIGQTSAPAATGAPARSVGAQPPQAQKAHMTVDFKNLPRGARVLTNKSAPHVDLRMGYNGLLAR
jgi:hypothetical protein